MSCHKVSENPFNIQWLAEHFHFDPSDVQKAEFNSLGLVFEVYFKSGKGHTAERFYETLTDRKCCPQYFELNNKVGLNKYLADKIIAAAHNAQILPIKEGEIPFQLEWLAENYNLNLTKVQHVAFSGLFGAALTIEFRPKSNLAVNAFVSTLRYVGCHPITYGNCIELTSDFRPERIVVWLRKSEKEELLKGAHIARTWTPLIKDKAEINQELQEALRLARDFLSIRNSARELRDHYVAMAGGDISLALPETGSYCLKDRHVQIELFIDRISPFLPFLQKILSNSEYKEKIQYYFLCDENLVLWMERCVNTTRALYDALLDVC